MGSVCAAGVSGVSRGEAGDDCLGRDGRAIGLVVAMGISLVPAGGAFMRPRPDLTGDSAEARLSPGDICEALMPEG